MLAVFLSIVAVPPILWILRRRYGAQVDGSHRVPAPFRVVAYVTALAYVAFVVAAGISLRDPTTLVYGPPELLDRSLWLPLIAAILTALLVVFLLVVWIRKKGSVFARLRFTLVTLACVAFAWQLHHWNLLEVDRAAELWRSLRG